MAIAAVAIASGRFETLIPCPKAAAACSAAEPPLDTVPVNAIVPAVGPEQAHAAVVRSGCRTAKVKVADHMESLVDDGRIHPTRIEEAHERASSEVDELCRQFPIYQ